MAEKFSLKTFAVCLAIGIWAMPNVASALDHPMSSIDTMLRGGIFENALPATSARPIIIDKVMGRLSLRIGTARNHKQWNARTPRIRNDLAALQKCLSTHEKAFCNDYSILKWAKLVRKARELSGYSQLAYVNNRVNALILYRTDYARFGQSDYWASPSQTIGKAGDCEDFALAKYLTLKSLGVSSENMKIVVLKNLTRNTYHAVLQLRDGNREFILDNLSGSLKQSSELSHYRPLYSINEKWKWMHPNIRKSARVKLAGISLSSPDQHEDADYALL